MTILRPRFGQPCFTCGDPVPTARIEMLRARFEREGLRFLRSDILCVEHAPGIAAATIERRPFSR